MAGSVSKRFRTSAVHNEVVFDAIGPRHVAPYWSGSREPAQIVVPIMGECLTLETPVDQTYPYAELTLPPEELTSD